MQRASIPIDLLFIDCKGDIRSESRTRLIEESGAQFGYNLLINKVAPWLRSYEYVHRRYSSNGVNYVVSYGVRFSMLMGRVSIESALRVKDDFAEKRILVINTVPSVPFDPHEELYIPVQHHAEIRELVNLKLYDWQCKLLVSPANVQPTATSASSIPAPLIPNTGMGIDTDAHMTTTKDIIEDEYQPFVSSRPVQPASPDKSKTSTKIKIKLLTRDTPEIPNLLASIKPKPITVQRSNNNTDTIPPSSITTEDFLMEDMSMQVVQAGEEDSKESSEYTSLMDSFEPMVDYHTGLHNELQQSINRLRNRLLSSSASPLPSNDGVSAVYELVEKLTDTKNRHSVFIELRRQLRIRQLEEQMRYTVPPPSKRRKIDSLASHQARGQSEISTFAVDIPSYFSADLGAEMALLGLPPSVYFEKEVQLEVYLAFEWSTERRILGPGCVTLSEKDWNAIRDWEKVYHGAMQYDSQTRYLICEFGCYKKSQLEDYFRHLFKRKEYRKAHTDAATINILPELEKLPVDSRPRIELGMKDVTIDWPNSDDWRVRLRIEGLQERVIDVMGLGYMNSKKKSIAEIIHSSYLSKDNPTRFSISVDSLRPREEAVVADRVFMIYTRCPTAMEITSTTGEMRNLHSSASEYKREIEALGRILH